VNPCEKKSLHIRSNSRDGKPSRLQRKDKANLCTLRLRAHRPLATRKILYRSKEPDWWTKVPPLDFIRRDLEDIERCDVLIAYMPRLSAGTCMELFHAKMKGKQTICICRLKNPSPWITAHSDILLKKISELEEALEKICEKKV